MWASRRRYRKRLGYFQKNVSVGHFSTTLHHHCPMKGQVLMPQSRCLWQVGAVVKIQAFFRARRARGDYQTLGNMAPRCIVS